MFSCHLPLMPPRYSLFPPPYDDGDGVVSRHNAFIELAVNTILRRNITLLMFVIF